MKKERRFRTKSLITWKSSTIATFRHGIILYARVPNPPEEAKITTYFLQTLIVGRQSFADKAAGKDSRPTIALFPMGEVKGQTNKSQLFKHPLRNRLFLVRQLEIFLHELHDPIHRPTVGLEHLQTSHSSGLTPPHVGQKPRYLPSQILRLRYGHRGLRSTQQLKDRLEIKHMGTCQDRHT